MDISVSEEELDVICAALQHLENAGQGEGVLDERLKVLRELFQRLQTLRTAK